VVLNSTNSSLAAHVSLANIHAGIRETVAKLVRWTVIIFNTIHSPASFTIGVSGE